MKIEILSLGILISAIFAIIFRQRDNIKMYSVFKPLTTILIISIAIIAYFRFSSNYTTMIIVSLVFSLIGDILLINKKYFLYGLSSFLLAYIGFTIAFSSLYGFHWNIIPLVILVLITGSYFIYLRKDLHKYSIPVAIYMTVIIIMNWQAIGLIFSNMSIVFFGIAIASLLFTFSDSLIAYNKFKRSFKIAEILILSTYWMSIYLFAIAGLYLD
ncbi:MAG: lysoplasmalogenase [Candidatus Marinimicrobia bacterium]|nr:lysoplasmalogenase [Candidatus Neomarinimicrobiota bacterium]